MRADAQHNLELLLGAAIDVMLETGPEAALDSIARRAGVGIGTLYRRFPDRASLINAVAGHVLSQSIEAAERAMHDSPDSFAALRSYMHVGVDLGIGVINLIYPHITDPDWSERRAGAAAILEMILERGKAEGVIRADVRIPDIGFAIIRFSRPVATDLSAPEERAIAHRHLDIYIDGLHPGGHITSPLRAAGGLIPFEPSSAEVSKELPRAER